MQRHAFTSQRTGPERGRSSGKRKFASGSGNRGRLYGFLLFVSAVLFAVDQTGHKISEDVRGIATDLSLPVLQVTSSAINTTRSALRSTRDYADLAQRYEVLRSENTELKRQRGEAVMVEARARAYETLLNYAPSDDAVAITAQTIADLHSPYAHSIIVNAGREDGVLAGLAVLGGNGVIGRVVSTGQKTSRILLVTDINSRIPVFVGAEKHRAILTGTNGSELALMHLPASAILNEGDQVITSGEGRLLPGGLAIGGIKTSAEGHPNVVLGSQPREAEMVRIVKYATDVDVEPGKAPLPTILMSDAEKAKADIQAAASGEVHAAVAVAAEPNTAAQAD